MPGVTSSSNSSTLTNTTRATNLTLQLDPQATIGMAFVKVGPWV